ncbi:sure-like protein [Lentinula edodes]|nr:sure-like protein [Lentinula edodes]
MQLPMLLFSILLVFIHACLLVRGQTKILIGNDDGWAVAIIRAQFNALANAGYDVILSCPAINLSGTGSLSLPPTIVLIPCEFDTCPILSPAEGFNASDPRLNYVNSFPVDAINFGINTLAPELLGGAPDFVVSGPNTTSRSSSRREQCKGAIFPTMSNTNASNIYATLTLKFLDALLSDIIPGPILPPGISLNVNYPAITNCPNEADYQFVLTRLVADSSATDVETCGTTQLPAESDVVALEGCFASVSVFDASTLLDVDAATQGAVLNRLSVFLKCAPSS